jgi:ParB-like chromosome segregation protein Spo0J
MRDARGRWAKIRAREETIVVHVDPVGSEETSQADLGSFDAEDLIGSEETPAQSAREGLPTRFRMRHGRHYVDELLGDTPLRTVREIPISDIEPPPDEALNLEPLEDSIRQVGVLEPLLVTRRGLEYRVIAGMRRLRAARTIGLSTVPCLVQEADEEKAMELRQAVAGRVAAPVPLEVPIESERTPPLELDSETGSGVATVTADELSDANAGIDPGLRRAVLDDLRVVEALRAQIASAASDLLSRTIVVERQPASPITIVGDALAAVALEARLRGVRLEMIWPDRDASMTLDTARCRTVLIGLLHSMLSLSTRETTALEVRTDMTIVRPALIVDCRLRQDGREQTLAQDAALGHFFNAEAREHPCGPSGARSLAALFRVARAHGGRVQATPTVVTLVIPKLLTEW